MDKIAFFHASYAEPMAFWSDKEKEIEKNTALQDPHVQTYDGFYDTHKLRVCIQ